jgi:hypothetical protein
VFCVGIVLVFHLGACSDPFSPQGPFRDELVVYALLSTGTETQFARLTRTYSPPAFNPLSHTVDTVYVPARVSISTAAASWEFRDTVVVREDKSRYSTDLRARVLHPFRPQPGTTYRLRVELPSGQIATAATTVPSSGLLSVLSYHVLDRPERFVDEDLYMFAQIGSSARGYLVRFFIEFEIVESSGRETRRLEVPWSIRISSTSNRAEPEYPTLRRRTSFESNRIPGREVIRFQNQAYQYARATILNEHARSNVVFKRAVFVLIQADLNLYNYYNIVNGFQDQFSIRTDLPDFSNINGGVGLFGSMTTDTLYVSYRETNSLLNLPPKNGMFLPFFSVR